jgi:carboxylesterase
MARKLRAIPQSNPAQSYAEAVERLEAWQAQEPAEVNPNAPMRWMAHGQRRGNAIILLHGLTATPYQFYPLGEAYYQRDYNVFIPLFPAHALQDRLTDEPAHLTAEQLVETLCRALDIAHGLGEKVSIAGLSMGGVVTSWAAQYRQDVEQAMIISPALAVRVVPLPLTPLVAQGVLLLPNFYKWWDPVLKADPAPPWNNYPRLSTHALAQVMRLGLLVQAEAKRTPPSARRVVMVTNSCDTSVDNRAADELVRRWQQTGAQNVLTYCFGLNCQLDHDLISLDHPMQNIELVHPILVDLICNS